MSKWQLNHEERVIVLNECEQLWVSRRQSRAAQVLDARLTNHVVAPSSSSSVNPALQLHCILMILIIIW